MIIDENPSEYLFSDIDKYLEKEAVLEPYKNTNELDGTLTDYLELIC